MNKASELLKKLERQDKPDYYIERLPPYISHFLGHRPGPLQPPPQILREISILVTTFSAMIITMSIFKYSAAEGLHAPEILPSFGAAAILIYNATGAPLAQPRNFVIGTSMSALIGICITKLFLLGESSKNHLWIAGALSTAVASSFMDLTGTTHPPGGAAALLPAIDSQVRGMGWLYLPAVLLTIVIFIAIGLLFNNIVLRYPLYWWKPKPPQEGARNNNEKNSIEKEENDDDERNVEDFSISIRTDTFGAPKGMVLSQEDRDAIATLQQRLLKYDYEFNYGGLI